MPPPRGHGLQEGRAASPASPTSAATQVLSERVTTHHLKLSNTTEIPQYFRLLVSRPFSVSQEGASRRRRAPGREQGCEEEQARAGKQLVLHPRENMLVSGGSAGSHLGPSSPSSHTHAHMWTDVCTPPSRTCAHLCPDTAHSHGVHFQRAVTSALPNCTLV